MEIAGIHLRRVAFPGRAGEFQRQGATAALVRELGDSYATYHAYLASALEKVGRPKPEQYSSMDAYLEAWDWVQQLVRAEVILRNCRAHRATGRELNAPLEFDVALIGPGDRLLSVE